MKILLAHNSLYFPSHGGGDKSNRLLMEALAAKDHRVRVIARVEHFGEKAHAELARQLPERGVPFDATPDLIRFTRNGVDVRTLTRSPHLRAYFAAQMEEFDPDVVLTSTDDPAQLMFEIACRAKRARVVYLIRATIAVPFGPDSSLTNAQKTLALRQADGVVGVSEYVAEYARNFGGLDAVHVPISLMEQGMTDTLGRFGNPYVTMVNPCAVKGIAIFLQLAARMPHLQFAAVPTWGTTPEEFAQLRALPNVTLLPPADDISDVLRQTRVMLVPSVWAEARSRMVMESMLRGVPVMASDVGGLREAKLGVPYLLPVNRIVHYRASLGLNMVPAAEVPPQDAGVWVDVLQRLTSNPPHWEAIAAESRAAALAYLETLTVAPFEAYLERIVCRPKKHAPAAVALSDDKKRLLALRLKQRANPGWFPACAPSASPKLFCFPHAGGGILAYRNWTLPGFATCPALLPGREARASEAPVESMPELIAALQEAIRPLMNDHCVFFGHSMGAGVAFELARALRRSGGPLPGALVVSGAKPPQYRRHLAPRREPSDEELTAELRALGGIADDLITLTLGLVRADTRLYRNYSYMEEPPLPLPLFAYSGDADPNVSPEQMAEWADQTSGAFRQRTFSGGHFYLRERLPDVLESIESDISWLAP